MSHVRGRRALRFSVLAASVAVLASFVVAPTARAESTDTSTTEAPSTEVAPSTSEPEATTPPTEAAPGTTDAPTTTPADAPVGPGEVAPGDTVVGELVQAWPDPTAEDAHHEDGDHAGEAPLSWIEPVEGDAVRVPTEDIPAVAVGSTIAVTVGDELTDEASAEQGFEPAVEVLDATVLDVAEPDPTTAETGTVPTNTVTAVLVVPAGGSADGTTITSVVNQLNGPVSSFWNAQSDGTVRIAAVAGATGWLSSSQSCANPSGLWNDIAGQIGWTSGPGKHLMLYLPASSTSCSYGLGTVGSSIGTGGRAYVRDVALSVMAHELGHNFGLGHSSEYQCNSALETGTCQTRDYYDFYDVMGISWGQVGSLNAAQAARLGLLPGSEQVALTPSSAATTVSLAPVSATSGVRAVKLTDSGGVVYYLEYRQASGQDAWLGDGRNAYGLNSGVVLRRAGSGSNTSLLLDGTPSPSSGWNSDMQQALPAGVVVSLAGGTFTATVTAVGASAQVYVTAGVSAQNGDDRCAGAQPFVRSSVALVDDGGATLAFVVGGDRALWSRALTPGSSWESLGGQVLFGPSVVRQSDGTLAVFVVGGNGAIFTRERAGGAWGPWTTLGGSTSSSPAVAITPTGDIRLFVRGVDNAMWSRSRISGTWTSWTSLQGVLSSAPTSASRGSDVVVSARGADGRVWSRTVLADGTAQPYGGGLMAVCSTLALVADQNAATVARSAFVGAGAGAWIVAPSGTLTSLAGSLSSAPAIVASPSSVTVAARGMDGALWVYDSTTSWTSWGGVLQ